MAKSYSLPSLILFPGQSIAVSDPQQTEQFFASSWAQYDGIHSIEKTLTVMNQGPGTTWVDVTWTYPGRTPEHFCYQLIQGAEGLQIAVLTVLG